MENKIQNQNENYYIINKEKFMKEFDSLIRIAKKIELPPKIEANIDLIVNKARLNLEDLFSRLPYVGGDDSPYMSLMFQSAQTIALYKAVKSFNLSNREIGKLIYDIAEKYAQSIPSIKKWFYRKAFFSKKMKNYWRKWSNKSLKREYSENWVAEFKEGKELEYNYGFDFLECGCLKLIKKEGGAEIAPYVCLCDYARMKAIGIGFRRTKTLAAGDELCDFRFSKSYQTQNGWPPENLVEFKI